MDLPDTPVGRQASWFLEHSRSRGAELTVDDVAARMFFAPPWVPDRGLARFHEADDRPCEVTKILETSPHVLTLRLDYGDERPWDLALTVEDVEPHRITRVFFSRALPEGTVIRPATDADGPRLDDLEVRAPMQLGGATVTYDRGDDFLGFGRLMGDNICLVAERGGELVGLACGALHTVRIAGRDHRAMLLHHLRVPVEHRKGGYFSALNSHVFGAYDGRREAAYGWTALENAEGMRIGGPGTWTVGAFRNVLDCAALAGEAHGRPATPADAPEIAAILNACHEGEEMYLPYTVESLAARLGRAPELYTWEHLLVGDGAVLGVWPARLGVTVDADGRRTSAVRGVVLDHGFVAGAQEELERLLRSWCARLLEHGHTQLSFVTGEGSAAQALATRLAAHVDAFSFRMEVPEPEGTRDRGLYVDAIYF